MNERIKQLKNQTLDKHFSYTWYTMNNDDVTLFAEKFAELIVTDILKMIENEALQYVEPTWAFELINDVKERYGVEK